jgi:hypothetical protein
MKDGKY